MYNVRVRCNQHRAKPIVNGHDMTPTIPILPLCVCGDPLCRIPYGFCHCQCGHKTRISEKTDRAAVQAKGLPLKFINGHARRRYTSIEDARPFKIDGVYCRLIPLSKGLYAIVDAADYQWLSRWKWAAAKGGSGHYAVRCRFKIDGEQAGPGIQMHRQVLGLGPADTDSRRGDHIESFATLDNRRKNLRIATIVQNRMNARKNRNNTSGFKGVSRHVSGRWRAILTVRGVRVYDKLFDLLEDARDGYRAAAIRFCGEFARFE